MRRTHSQKFPKNTRLYHNPKGCLKSRHPGAKASHGALSQATRTEPKARGWQRPRAPKSNPTTEIPGSGVWLSWFLNPPKGASQIQPRVQQEPVSRMVFQWGRTGHWQGICATQTPAEMEKAPRGLYVQGTLCLVSASLSEKMSKSSEQFSLMLNRPKALKEMVMEFKIWWVESPRGPKFSSWRAFKKLHWKCNAVGAQLYTQAPWKLGAAKRESIPGAQRHAAPLLKRTTRVSAEGNWSSKQKVLDSAVWAHLHSHCSTAQEVLPCRFCSLQHSK